MRKDRIEEKAYQKALELYYSEGGFHGTGIDADDVPVLRPQVSRLKREDAAWEPNSAFYGGKPVGATGKRSFVDYGEERGTGEYNAMEAELERLMGVQEQLSGSLRAARQRGNFAEEHRIVQERNDVMKAISALEARMAVNDLGRQQRDMNDGMMYDSQDAQDEENPFPSYAEAIEANNRKIAELEAAYFAYAEKMVKGATADSAADPGQNYAPADDEEDDEEEDDEDEEELGAA